MISSEFSNKYCRFHLDQELTDSELEKIDKKKYETIFCPYEPKNAILKSKFEEHLKTCPKRLELEKM